MTRGDDGEKGQLLDLSVRQFVFLNICQVATRSSQMKTRRYLTEAAITLALVVFAGWLRWPGLGATELSFADSWVALIVHLDSPLDIMRVGIVSPGFTLLMKLWFNVVGFSATAAQIPAFLAGAAAPGTAYLLGRRMNLGMLPSTAAGLFLAMAPAHIARSVHLKQYTLDALAVLALFWVAWRVIDSDPTKQRARLVVLTVAAIALSLASASLAPVAIAAVATGALHASRKGRIGEAAAALGAYIVVFGAWGLLVLQRITPDRLTAYWDGYYITGWSDGRRVLSALGSGFAGIDNEWVLIVLAAFAFAAAGWLLRKHTEASVLLVGPWVVAIGLAMVGRVPLGTGRGDVYLYPLLALGGAYVVGRVISPWWGQALIVIPLLLLALPLPESRYREVGAVPLVNEMAASRTPEDQVISNYGTLYTMAVYGPWMDGLETGIHDVRGFLPTWTDRRIVGLVRDDTPEEFRTTLVGEVDGNRVWILFDPRTQPWTGDIIREVMRTKGYELVSKSQNRNSTLQLWTYPTP